MIKEIYPNHLACLSYKFNISFKKFEKQYNCIISNKIDKPAFTQFLRELYSTKKSNLNRFNKNKPYNLKKTAKKNKKQWRILNVNTNIL